MNDSEKSRPTRDDILTTAMFGGWILGMLYVPEIARLLTHLLK